MDKQKNKKPTLWQKIKWFMSDLCSECGGELNVFDYKRAWCKVCGKKN